MKRYLLTLIFFLFILLLLSCNRSKYSNIVWLDEIPFGVIINPFGHPQKNLSFTKDSISIINNKYSRGLGVNAPSDLIVQLNGEDAIFKAIIGLDSGTKKFIISSEEDGQNNDKGPSFTRHNISPDTSKNPAVYFKIYADNRKIYQSKIITAFTRPERIKLTLKGAEELRLVVDPVNDAYTANHANWAMAYLRFREDVSPASLLIHSEPDAILHNQAGYRPDSYKTCIMPSGIVDSLYVYNNKTGEMVFSTTINIVSGDMGKYIIADFTDLETPGEYYLFSAGKKSGPFLIDKNIYKKIASENFSYIKTQRKLANNGEWGKNISCVGMDTTENKKHKFEFNASDNEGYRIKFLNSLVFMQYVLSIYLENTVNIETKKLIWDEIQYNNRFLFKLQNPDGYLGNYLWNCINISEDASQFTENPVNINDSIFRHYKPSLLFTHFIYAMAQARISRLMKTEILEYSETCMRSALKGFNWALKNCDQKDAAIIGAATGAVAEMFVTEKNEEYKLKADKFISYLLALSKDSPDKPFGFFMTSGTDTLPMAESEYGKQIWPLAGICIYLRVFPESRYSENCKAVISNYYMGYSDFFTARNAFNLVPYSLYNSNPGGNRKYGNYYYRYFPEHIDLSTAWKGINTHISSTAAGLVMASDILDQPGLRMIAQKQLDWICGANPFNKSFITGMGYNHPQFVASHEYSMVSEPVSGGVMAGIGSDHNDAPALYPAWPQTSSYWLPAVLNTLWLAVLLEGSDKH